MEEGKKQEKKGCFSVMIVVCIVLIMGLDIFAGFVGLRAEAAQQAVKHTRVLILECKAPSKTAFMLGIIAVSCLVVAHIITNLIGSCISNLLKGFVGPPKMTRYFNVACLCLTWIVGIVGASILLLGIWSNRDSRSKCGFTNKHFLSFGGKMCFIHAIISFVYLVSSFIADKCCL